MQSSLEPQRDFTAVTPSGRRLAFLDVLRGAAALSVCLQHELEQMPRFRALNHASINFGAFGVAVFFIISGFIIPASLEKYGSLRQFWKGRILRIYPMYLAVLGATILADTLLHRPICAGPHATLPCVAANLTLASEFLGFPMIVGVAWTLALEFVFYILFSVIFFFGWERLPERVAFATMGLFLAMMYAGRAVHRSVPAGRLGMLVLAFYGFLIFNVFKERVARRWLHAGTLLLVVVLLQAFWLRFHGRAELDSFGEVAFNFTNICITWLAAIAFFLVLYSVRHRAMPASLQWLGKVSYSFYLLAGFWPVVFSLHVPVLVSLAIELAVLLPLSALTYRWIERPFMHLGTPQRRMVPQPA